MDRDVIVKRIAELEGELASINCRRASLYAWPGCAVASFLLSYWVLLSFLVAIGTVAYVQFGIGVDYFEQYRNPRLCRRRFRNCIVNSVTAS